MRKGKASRETKETSIDVVIDLDGKGEYEIDSGIPFFDHMLESFSKHSGFDLDVFADGDLEVGFHHVIEDIGLVLGDALKKAVNKKEIKRFGHASIPMDDSISIVSIDFGGRSYLVSDLPNESVSDIDFRVFKHFFKSFVDNAGITMHMETRGEDPHHMIESLFKASGIALKESVNKEKDSPRSTKGVL